MNKVYCFYDEHDSENRAVYIAEKDYKTARNIALADSDGTFDFSDNLFIDLRGHMCRYNQEPKGKPITTEKIGQLDVKDLAELNLLWFYCPDCGSNKLSIIGETQYMCGCGHIDNIPFI